MPFFVAMHEPNLWQFSSGLTKLRLDAYFAYQSRKCQIPSKFSWAPLILSIDVNCFTSEVWRSEDFGGGAVETGPFPSLSFGFWAPVSTFSVIYLTASNCQSSHCPAGGKNQLFEVSPTPLVTIEYLLIGWKDFFILTKFKTKDLRVLLFLFAGCISGLPS